MTEIQLIEACRREESPAQRWLYEQYAEGLLLLCLRYIREQTDAEEVLSDVFLKCFRHIGGFRYAGPGSLRAWLSKIAVNECLMFLRRKKQLVIAVDEEQMPAETADTAAILEQIAARDILRYIRQLPDGYRTVLNLYVFEELSHKDIARMLQISENTSKSQLFKARALLKQKIQEQR